MYAHCPTCGRRFVVYVSTTPSHKRRLGPCCRTHHDHVQAIRALRVDAVARYQTRFGISGQKYEVCLDCQRLDGRHDQHCQWYRA